MYRNVCYNSFFNLVFCLINSFSLINVCIYPRSAFCSSIYKNEASQYFKIYFILFLGNALKLCCNLSYILFSLSRFFIASSNKSSFASISSIKLRILYIVIFCVSLIVSSFKIAEYKPNEYHSSFDLNFPYNLFDLKYCQFNSVLDLYSFKFKCQLFPILNLLNSILNNIVFLIVSLCIDISMTRFANQNFERKKAIFHDQKHVEEALKHKKKVNKLIITNGILYLFSHIPEFCATVLYIIYQKKLRSFCFFHFSCTEFIEIFETFSLVTISLQFFVLRHFDHNIRHQHIKLAAQYIKCFSKN